MLHIRTLFVSNSGLENAKKLVSSYKQGQSKSMTPEIWQAKKVVDSTLHPGMGCDDIASPTSADLGRYRPASLSTFPHVLLRSLELSGDGWHAHTWSSSTSNA